MEWLNTSNAATGPFMGINVDLDGTVWVRHGTTLSWWDGERWQRVIAPDGSTNFVALKTGPCRAGGMWVSSSNGLRRLRPESLASHELEESTWSGGRFAAPVELWRPT